MTVSLGHIRPASIAAFLAVAVAPAAADDWPGLRGPNHDGRASLGSRLRAGPGALVVRWRGRVGPG